MKTSAQLDDKLRELAGAGNFSHLSIYSVWGGDNQFKATFSPAIGAGQSHGVGSDPVSAALAAIENAPAHSPARRSQPREGTGQQQTRLPRSRAAKEGVQANVLRESPVDFDDLFKKKGE